MSMFGNMVDAGKMFAGSFTQDDVEIDDGMSELENALLMQQLQSQPINAMQGTMFGMPGQVSPTGKPPMKAIEVDEMQQAQSGAAPSFGGGADANNMGGNMASTAMMLYSMFSDRRLKKNIQRIGEFKGHNVYRFDYLWDEDGTGRVGVMADEVPHAAFPHESGYLMVDYSRI